jgi:hypothetical protein
MTRIIWCAIAVTACVVPIGVSHATATVEIDGIKNQPPAALAITEQHVEERDSARTRELEERLYKAIQSLAAAQTQPTKGAGREYLKNIALGKNTTKSEAITLYGTATRAFPSLTIAIDLMAPGGPQRTPLGATGSIINGTLVSFPLLTAQFENDPNLWWGPGQARKFSDFAGISDRRFEVRGRVVITSPDDGDGEQYVYFDLMRIMPDSGPDIIVLEPGAWIKNWQR